MSTIADAIQNWMDRAAEREAAIQGLTDRLNEAPPAPRRVFRVDANGKVYIVQALSAPEAVEMVGNELYTDPAQFAVVELTTTGRAILIRI